ncbi:MAG TPA: hypothetical protein VHC22_07405 [Pirellulales bacterium]|nr:hypothetical protein [Pirellulales bacterium]
MRIAWFGLLDSDEVTSPPRARAERHLLQLGQQVVAAAGVGATIELISCGASASTRTLAPGVERVVLVAAGRTHTVWDRVSWALPEVIDRADLVHLHEGFSRSCELALLVAKQLRKPVCVTEWGIEGYWLSTELRLSELADVIICHDRAGPLTPTCTKPVETIACDIDIRQLGVPAPWPANACLAETNDEIAWPTVGQYRAAGSQLWGVYGRLTAGARRAAA